MIFVLCHERDSVTRFSTIFLLKRFNLGPIWTGENGFVNFFVLAKIFDSKVRKLHVRVVNDTQIFLFTNVFIFLNYCNWVGKNTQDRFLNWLFLYNLWEAFKVFRKCQCSLVRVRVVVDYRDTHFLQISSRKQKNLLNRYCLFIWGPGGYLFYKKVSQISWHCPFSVGFPFFKFLHKNCREYEDFCCIALLLQNVDFFVAKFCLILSIFVNMYQITFFAPHSQSYIILYDIWINNILSKEPLLQDKN